MISLAWINPHGMQQELKGRGAQVNTSNPYLSLRYDSSDTSLLDEEHRLGEPTRHYLDHPKSIVNHITSEDLGFSYSLNPYQGCEHGCVYCYARNSHPYWGFSAGLDFEQKVVVKKNAPVLFRKFLEQKSWKGTPISISGNTDCYQPAERSYELTRQILDIALRYRQPVSLITKNALIIRDIDILREMASRNLVHVYLSITSMDEHLRRIMEPRTSTYTQRFKTLEELRKAGIRTGIMNAPIIPGLNDHEIFQILKCARDAGAVHAGYTMVRLNDAVKTIFTEWIQRHFPDRSAKVLHHIASCHGGELHDSKWHRRMKGEGPVAESIDRQFRIFTRKLGFSEVPMSLDSGSFRVPTAQLSLFDPM